MRGPVLGLWNPWRHQETKWRILAIDFRMAMALKEARTRKTTVKMEIIKNEDNRYGIHAEHGFG